MSRGDLSESEWRVLKDLLPIEAVNRGRGRRPEQNRAIINAYFGDFVAVRRGAMFHPNMAIGIRSIDAFGAGAKPGSGRLFRSRSLRSWLTAATIASIAPQFGPIFRQRAEKGDSSTRSWPLAGRVHQ